MSASTLCRVARVIVGTTVFTIRTTDRLNTATTNTRLTHTRSCNTPF